MTTTHRVHDPSTPLGFVTKLAYGAGDLGPAIVAAIQGFFLNAFLLEVAGLRPAAAGAIFLIVKIWDAVNDPLIGMISDRTQSKWGRRRPWLLFGAVPFGLAFFLLWLVPPLGPAGKFAYYLLIAVLLDTAFTAVNVPYAAMTAELSDDYDERTSLNAFRFSFSILGGVIAAALHLPIVGMMGDVQVGYAVSAAIWAVIIIGSNIVTFLFTPAVQPPASDEPEPGFFEGLRLAFSNRAFVYVTMIYLLAWLSIQFVQNNLLLYVRYWMDAADQFMYVILAVQFTAFAALLFWARLSNRIGKKWVYYIGMGFWVAAAVVLFFVQPGQMWLLYIVAVVAGMGVAVGYLVPWSMLPDVIELDELKTGKRREGVFYGFFVFLQKLGLSLGLALSNFALEATGFLNPTSPDGPFPVQPDAVLLTLRVVVSFAPAVVLLLSFVVVWAYPITRDSHAETLKQLAARKAGRG